MGTQKYLPNCSLSCYVYIQAESLSRRWTNSISTRSLRCTKKISAIFTIVILVTYFNCSKTSFSPKANLKKFRSYLRKTENFKGILNMCMSAWKVILYSKIIPSMMKLWKLWFRISKTKNLQWLLWVWKGFVFSSQRTRSMHSFISNIWSKLKEIYQMSWR